MIVNVRAVCCLAVMLALLAGCKGGAPRNLVGTFGHWEPVDDARGYAYFSVYNGGSKAETAKCTVDVSNDFGNFGFDSLVGENVASGQTLQLKMAISVGSGSRLINKGTVKDC